MKNSQLIVIFDELVRRFAMELGHQFDHDCKIFIQDINTLPKKVHWIIPFLKIFNIVYISTRAGQEANYVIFLDENLNKIHETYL